MSHDRDEMREMMLAYYLDALGTHETARIRELVRIDPAWQEAAEEARLMQAGLEAACALEEDAPRDLAARVTRDMRSPFRGASRALAAVAGVAAAALIFLGVWWLTVAPSRGALLWRANDQLLAGGLLVPELVVRAPDSGEPLADIDLSASLRADNGPLIALGSGRTSGDGVLTEPWRVPDIAPGNYTLRVEARDGDTLLDRYETTVAVRSSARLVVAPDRPAARPGEVIRVRALFKRDDGGAPMAEREITFDLVDFENNRLGHHERVTSRHGLAWTQFPLDRELPEGTYTIVARSEGVLATCTFRLEQYRLPVYDVRIELARPTFGESERVTGRVTARTFDGHSIAGLQVDIRHDLEQASLLMDESGLGEFSLAPLKPGVHRMRVEVIDAAGQRAEAHAVVRVSGGVGVIHLLPESGELVPGVENRVYVVARTLDGVPYRGTISIRHRAKSVEVPLDENGVGVWTVREFTGPKETVLVNGLEHLQELLVRRTEHGLLVRCASAVVAAGGSVFVEVFSARETGVVMLSLKRDARTVAMAIAKLEGGRGAAALRVPAGLNGSVTVEATRLGEGSASSDRKLLLVRSDSALRIRMQSDKSIYRPGDRARLSFEVLDAEGHGVPAALSVVGVDAALLALAGSNPGLVQALRAAEMRVVARPNFPFDAAALIDGVSGRAHATVASLRPPTLRAMRAQLDEVLPAAVLDSVMRDDLEAMFAPDGDSSTRREREMFLSELERLGHGNLVRALRDVVPDASDPGAGWVDGAPQALAVARARRSAIGGWALTAFAAAFVLAIAYVLCARRESLAGNAMALVTLLSLAVGTFGCKQTSDPYLFAIVIWACTLVAHVGLLVSMPSRRRAALAMQLTLLSMVAIVAVFGDAAAALIPIGVVFAILQWSAELRTPGWVGAVVVSCLVLVIAGMVVAIVPKCSMLATDAEMRISARNVASLVATNREGITYGMLTNSATARITGPARIRDDFRETLLFAPEVITDENGRATIDTVVPDSLTRWVLQADAITTSGGVAHTVGSLAVSQPLAVDLVLPAAVSEGDLLMLRAVVRNTTDEVRNVQVRLDRPGAKAQTVSVGAHRVVSVDWPVRFATPGEERLTVTAESGREHDTVVRVLRVEPFARAVRFGGSRQIEGSGSIPFSVPAGSRRELLTASVRVHPTPLTQVIEGLDSMLREPHGCFEQTSSINYPNIMVLRYLKQAGRADPILRARAEDLLARGTQRLLTFEVNRSGGFSLYGNAPASVWLTAYGLMQFRDMERVQAVDPALLARVKGFLRANGRNARGLDELAYVVMALGRDAPRELVSSLSDQYASLQADAYLCALGALAMAPHDLALAGSLAAQLPKHVRDGVLYGRRSLGWRHGRGTAAETTALAALALMKTGKEPVFAQTLIRKLPELAHAGRGWGTTHATVFALKALLAAAPANAERKPVRVTIEASGETIELNEAKLYAPIVVRPGDGSLRVRVEPRDVVVRLAGTAFVPWGDGAPAADGIRFAIAYDRTEVRRGGVVRGIARLERTSRAMDVPMIEWGMPAGFRPVDGDLAAHVAAGRLRRWERSGRMLRLYLPPLPQGVYELPVTFIATAAGELHSAASRAYPYYEPDRVAVERPHKFTVR